MDKTGQDTDDAWEAMSPWQQQAITLWSEGLRQKDIADHVGKSVRTVNRFLRSESTLKLSQKIRSVQWDQLTTGCSLQAPTLLARVNQLMESPDDTAAIRACNLMRQLIRDTLELDLGARLAEVENQLAELDATEGRIK